MWSIMEYLAWVSHSPHFYLWKGPSAYENSTVFFQFVVKVILKLKHYYIIWYDIQKNKLVDNVPLF